MLQAVVVARSLAEAHAALGAGARLMAGGTAVMPDLAQGTDAVTEGGVRLGQRARNDHRLQHGSSPRVAGGLEAAP